ncbi:MAG: RND family efflux transporter MFP [Geobacteraceae bacterium]|nr:MAG: RND family efflux transporter MFP [Geobacteraceae bacterium]
MANEDLSRLKIDKSAALRPARRGRKAFWAAAGVLVVLLVFLAAKGIFTPAVVVEIATISQVYPSQTFTMLNASGYVVAQRKAAVAAKTTGRLEWLGVEEGNRVKEGEVIARLENMDAAASRDQAKAQLNNAVSAVEQAKAELNDATLAYNRQKELVAQGVVAQADVDVAFARFKKANAAVAGAEAAVIAARAALKGAEVALDYSFIRAPFDAVVLTKNADVGDIVTPIGAAANAKAAVVTIADMGSLLVEADVSEANLEKTRVGQPCEIQLDAFPDSRFRGAVHMIVPTADRSKATVLIKVRFLEKDSRILPEMSAKVAFLQRAVKPEERNPRIAVNPAALISHDGKKGVYLIKGDHAAEIPVTTGAQIGDMIEIVSGVKAGDKVALKPLDKLKNGARIKTAEK